MNILSMEMHILVGDKYKIANYNHCMIDIKNSVHQLYQGKIFTDIIKNAKTALFYPCFNVIIETLITQVTHMVFHDSIRK